MNRYFVFPIVFVVGMMAISACSKKSKYESLVREGLESGIRHDTLFLGLYLGMSSEDFYTHCWELNKQGIIRQGDGNSSVLYEMKDEFKAEVDMNFYPNFYDNKIYEMPVKFKYKGWSPWTKPYSGDTLQLELVELYKKWYGNGFIEVDHSTRGKAFVKVDGNRRISIYRDHSADGTVWVLYRDMARQKEVEQSLDSAKYE